VYLKPWRFCLVWQWQSAVEQVWLRGENTNPISTGTAIAHVRYATAGEPSYENTHPLTRELGVCNPLLWVRAVQGYFA